MSVTMYFSCILGNGNLVDNNNVLTLSKKCYLIWCMKRVHLYTEQLSDGAMKAILSASGLSTGLVIPSSSRFA